MKQFLANLSILVPDYDEAIDYYTNVLLFDLIEDTVLSESKRWVRVKPAGATEQACHLLLAKAATPQQQLAIGNQSGNRVFLFLYTDNFDRDYEGYMSRGVVFESLPRQEAHGKVAVFVDRYGNRWDLIQPA
jgi:catechol 2,3-dioxygenase-like lactoylglutathione lyase family enzyme